MPVHPIDFELQTDFYSTPELRAVFDEKERIGRWLHFEAALAASQGELGVIPADSAARIVEMASLDKLDLEKIRDGYKTTRNSVMPVLKALRTACGAPHGGYVHHGATTQDVVDTGAMLELKQALAIILRDMQGLEASLMALAEKHRATPMIGRSHGQQAIPITFGMKVAVWLGEISRHIERLEAVSQRALFGQLGGAVGTLAAIADKAPDIKRRTMEKLGLGYSLAAWHTSRDNVAEVCSVMTMATISVAKIADEVFELGRTEFGELREPPGSPTAMSSSTMPHKRNPVLSERVVVISSHVRALLSVVMEAMMHQNERDVRSLWSEWLAVPQIALYTGTAVAYVRQIVDGLEVYPQRMLDNLHIHGDLVASEWLLFRLSDRIGKVKAQETLHQAGQMAAESHQSLVDILRTLPETASVLEDSDVQVAEHPEQYRGWAEKIVDDAILAVRQARNLDQCA